MMMMIRIMIIVVKMIITIDSDDDDDEFYNSCIIYHMHIMKHCVNSIDVLNVYQCSNIHTWMKANAILFIAMLHDLRMYHHHTYDNLYSSLKQHKWLKNKLKHQVIQSYILLRYIKSHHLVITITIIII